MRARVSDPIGPRWLRALAPAFAVLVMSMAVLLPIEAATAKGLVFFVGAALFFGAGLALPRLRPRPATIALGDGYIDIADAGVARQRIRTRDVTAASTARTRDGVALALVRKGRDDRPLVLDLASDDDARRVRDALGIGHFGFGSLEWPTKLANVGVGQVLARLGAAASMLMLAAAMREEAWLGPGAWGALLFVPAALLLMTIFRRPDRRPMITMRPDGLAITPDGQNYDMVPYANVEDATVTPRGLRITRHVGAPIDVVAPEAKLGRGALSMDERTHLVAQILSAAQRAHGEGPVAPPLPESVAGLAKRDERGRSWLARLDATAQLLASGTGYRGCGFEEVDLWTTLEDPDAPADLRAAAARVLVRVAKENAKARVGSVLARTRDDAARERIRIATDDDIEGAGEELDELERNERRRHFL